MITCWPVSNFCVASSAFPTFVGVKLGVKWTSNRLGVDPLSLNSNEYLRLQLVKSTFIIEDFPRTRFAPSDGRRPPGTRSIELVESISSIMAPKAMVVPAVVCGVYTESTLVISVATSVIAKLS
jgi:hypothetical protein